MFFTTDGRREEIESNIDQYNDSYARDTTKDELKEVWSAICPTAHVTNCLQILERMTDQNHIDSPDAINKIIGRIQERAASGFELPKGWLFKGLVFYFNQESTTESSEGHTQRLSVASNIARFAGAAVVGSLKNSNITHVITDPDLPSAERSALRGSLSTRSERKVPHIVTTKWIEDCWSEGTLLDEESKCLVFPTSVVSC